MGNQMQQGDLAVIVGAFNVVGNIGQTCELIEFITPGSISFWRDPADGMRIRNATHQAGWLVVGEGLKSWCGSSGWCLVHPRHLMPLRGDFQPEQQKSREAEPCA